MSTYYYHKCRCQRAEMDEVKASFDVAYWESRNNGGTLVHGVVCNPWTKKKFWYAWVERDGVVYDNKQHYLSVDDFYKMFKPKQVRRYNEEKAMINSVRAGHKGPWTLNETSATVRALVARLRASGGGRWGAVPGQKNTAGRLWTDDQIARVCELKAAGATYSAITEQTGVPRGTAHRFVKALDAAHAEAISRLSADARCSK